jgi:hypothetical protein
MVTTSKSVSFVILGLVALVCSRTFFYFIHDSEGPNLLIVGVLAVLVFGVSLGVYFFSTCMAEYKRVGGAVVAEVFTVVILYLFLA